MSVLEAGGGGDMTSGVGPAYVNPYHQAWAAQVQEGGAETGGGLHLVDDWGVANIVMGGKSVIDMADFQQNQKQFPANFFKKDPKTGIQRRFTCLVCNVSLFDENLVRSHCSSAEHHQRLSDPKRDRVQVSIKKKSVDKRRLQTVLEASDEPAVGLENVVEWWPVAGDDQDQDNPIYTCQICDGFVGWGGEAAKHVTGEKHRRKQLSTRYPVLEEMIRDMDLSELKERAREEERKHQRRYDVIQYVVDLESYKEFYLQLEKQPYRVDPSSSQRHPPQGHPPPLRGGPQQPSPQFSAPPPQFHAPPPPVAFRGRGHMRGGHFGPDRGGHFGPHRGGHFGQDRGGHFGPARGGPFGQARGGHFAHDRGGGHFGPNLVGGHFDPDRGGAGRGGNFGPDIGGRFKPERGHVGPDRGGHFGPPLHRGHPPGPGPFPGLPNHDLNVPPPPPMKIPPPINVPPPINIPPPTNVPPPMNFPPPQFNERGGRRHRGQTGPTGGRGGHGVNFDSPTQSMHYNVYEPPANSFTPSRGRDDTRGTRPPPDANLQSHYDSEYYINRNDHFNNHNDREERFRDGIRNNHDREHSGDRFSEVENNEDRERPPVKKRRVAPPLHLFDEQDFNQRRSSEDFRSSAPSAEEYYREPRRMSPRRDTGRRVNGRVGRREGRRNRRREINNPEDDEDLPEACYAVSADQEELDTENNANVAEFRSKRSGKDLYSSRSNRSIGRDYFPPRPKRSEPRFQENSKKLKDIAKEETPYEGPTIFDKVFRTKRKGEDDGLERNERERDKEMEKEWKRYKEETKARIKREKEKLHKYEKRLKELEASTSNAELSLQQAEQRSAKKRKRSGSGRSSPPAAYGGGRSAAYSSSDSDRESSPLPRQQELASSPDQKQSPAATDRDKCQAKFDPY